MREGRRESGRRDGRGKTRGDTGWGGWLLAAGAATLLALAAVPPLRAEWRALPGAGRAAGPRVRWAGEGVGDLAARMVSEPTVFALGSPVGFTRALGEETAGRGAAAEAALRRPATPAPPARTAGKKAASGMPAWPASPAGAVAPGAGAGRRAGGERWGRVSPGRPEMAFSEGWEGRMFAGADLDFASWAPGAPGWRAAAEAEFDAKGVPARVFVVERSGVPAVDRTLSREVWAWRLRDAEAPRKGRIVWRVPSAGAGAEEGTAAATTTGPGDGASAEAPR